MLGFPESVRVGAMNYKVEFVEGLRSEASDEKLNGHILHDTSLIRIDAALGRQAALITLVHEIIHGCLANAAVYDHPENIVEVLGYGIVQVLQDNPAVASLIQAVNTDG